MAVIRLARIDGGTVAHLARWTGTMKWRSECNRVRFTWEDGREVGRGNNGRGASTPAAFDVLDRPLCVDCLRRVEADRRQVDEWLAAQP